MLEFENEDRLLTSTKTDDEFEVENVLRPKAMSEYVGQEKIKKNVGKARITTYK